MTPATVSRFAPDVFDPDALSWELYYLPDDFSQANDLAAEHPEKVAELSALWWQEAEANYVTPLLAGMSAFFGIVPPLSDKTRWTFWGGDVQNVPQGIMPPILNRSYSITADVTIPEGGARGLRPPRRLQPIRDGRQAAPHLQFRGNRDLPAPVRLHGANRKRPAPARLRGRRTRHGRP